MKDKCKKTEELRIKIKQISESAIKNGNYEKALAAISFMGEYLYQYNQYYADDDLENFLSIISEKLKKKWKRAEYDSSSERIIFYDGFGLDTRGVVLMYLNALGLNGYKVIYVTNKKCENQIPTIKNMCQKYGMDMIYVNFEDYINWAKQLSDVFEQFKPRSAFFYTTPNDVSGIVAFHMYQGLCDRYLIDLTDHAFWLGKAAVDFFTGSRDMAAYLQHFQRGIKREQMIRLGVNPRIEECHDHSGLPFDPEKNEYIFSGGALYKTLGDTDNKYYRIVDHVLEKHDKLRFLYCGTGDDSEMMKIIEKYPNRAFLIDERKDFYYLIQHCVVYLNTYPMFGGMMMKYCGLAQKIPVTLKHDNDSDGLLLNQSKCNVEYDTYEDLIADVDKLIDDVTYRTEREKMLEGSVITEERFKNNIRGVIENHRTDYEYEFQDFDTSKFRKEYYDRFDLNIQMENMVKIKNLSLIWNFPSVFIKGGSKKLKQKLLSWR